MPFSAILRTKAFGAFSVKSYNNPDGSKAARLLKGSLENEIEVVPRKVAPLSPIICPSIPGRPYRNRTQYTQ